MFTIAIDWLQAMFRCAEILPVPTNDLLLHYGRITLVPCAVQGNKFFSHSWTLRFDDEDFGVVFSHSRSPQLLDRDLVQLKIFNHHLYRDGFLSLLRSVCDSLRWSFHNVSRLDIAIDGVFDALYNTKTGEVVYEKGVRSFLQEEYVGKRAYSMMGKALLSASSLDTKTGNFAGFYIGKSTSDKVLSIYDKSREIQSSCKEYIRDFWVRSGLTDVENVERVELRLRSGALRVIEGFDFWRLDNPAYLASIARTHFENWFEFVPSSEDSNRSRAKKRSGAIAVIDWSAVGATYLEKRVVAPADVFKCKVSIRNLYEMAQRGEIARAAAQIAISACVERGRLQRWYMRKVEVWGGLPVDLFDSSALDEEDMLFPASMVDVFDAILE